MKTFILFFLLLPFLCISQSRYVKSNSIGMVNAEPENKRLYGPLNYRTLQELVGEKFILLPSSQKNDVYGYQGLYKVPYRNLLDNVKGDSAGKIITLKKLEGIHGQFYDIYGQEYQLTAYSGYFDHIAPVRDIDSARIMFLNKTLWLKGSSINTYDEATGKFGIVPNLRLEPLKVIDIVAAWYVYSPVRFILETKDKKIGFIDCNMSGSNTSQILITTSSFDGKFWRYDIKQMHHFTPQIWKLIKTQDVINGMTKEQVIMSLGNPDKINYSSYLNSSSEQWVYGTEADRSYYYFKGNVLIAQN